MSRFQTAIASVQTAVLPLLLDARFQAAAALALALAGGLLLGSDGVDAMGAIGNKPGCYSCR